MKLTNFSNRYKSLCDFGSTFVISSNPLYLIVSFLIVCYLTYPVLSAEQLSVYILLLSGVIITVMTTFLFGFYILAPIAGMILERIVIKKYNQQTVSLAYKWLNENLDEPFSFEQAALSTQTLSKE